MGKISTAPKTPQVRSHQVAKQPSISSITASQLNTGVVSKTTSHSECKSGKRITTPPSQAGTLTTKSRKPMLPFVFLQIN
jgi:hypothetical protein